MSWGWPTFFVSNATTGSILLFYTSQHQSSIICMEWSCAANTATTKRFKRRSLSTEEIVILSGASEASREWMMISCISWWSFSMKLMIFYLVTDTIHMSTSLELNSTERVKSKCSWEFLLFHVALMLMPSHNRKNNCLHPQANRIWYLIKWWE